MTAAGATFYADRAQLQAWFDRAAPGASAIYASGPALDRGNETVRTVVGWKDAGLVTCHLAGRSGGLLRYQVKKAVSPGAGAAGDGADAPARGALPRGWAHRPEGTLYRLLCERAGAAAPCPSYAEIAEALGLADRFAARALFQKLVKAGAVRVIARPPRAVPVVEIAATGKRTAGAKENSR